MVDYASGTNRLNFEHILRMWCLLQMTVPECSCSCIENTQSTAWQFNYISTFVSDELQWSDY